MDDTLRKKLAIFIYAFEQVFDGDWNYSQQVLEVGDLVRGRKFLEHDQYTDWGAHEALVSAYEDLVEEMARQKIPRADEL